MSHADFRWAMEAKKFDPMVEQATDPAHDVPGLDCRNLTSI